MTYQYNQKTLSPATLQDPFVANLPQPMQAFLAGRNVDNPKEIYQLFHGTMQDILDNLSMQDSDKAIAHLSQAIAEKETIVVYRDYDCDGCCAAAVAVESLAQLGATVYHYGNERAVDGYGICPNGIDNILAMVPNTKVILTVDNGIVAHGAVEYALSKGLTVLITDHHEMGDSLPAAHAVVDPKRKDEFCSFHELCGAGVIFKVMLGLYLALNRDIRPVLATVDIVALATVGDIVPMVGENRILVKEGLSLMEKGARPFFREVQLQLKLKEFTAESELAFQIVPMINAPSRMAGDVNRAVTALLEGPGPMLTEHVQYLKDINTKRKAETEEAQRYGKKELEVQGIDPETTPLILLCCEHMQEGLVGLVASRLLNKYHKIVGVFHKNDQGMLKGSMRGVDGFHLKEALDNITPGILAKYGGHAKAAGLSMPADQFNQFSKEFTDLVLEAMPSGYEPVTQVDLQLTAETCSVPLVELLQQLRPFGESFSAPLVELYLPNPSVRYMGNNKQHVSYDIENISAVRWSGAEEEQAHPNTSGLFRGSLGLNHWNGRTSIQLICK